MGSVWAAKLHGPYDFEKLVAIKTVLPDLAGDDQVRARFLDEARLASAITHRNVAHVHDFLEHDGALYIVMEWVDGVSLTSLHEQLEARGAQVPTGIALRLLADVCAGLHAAHDLKNASGQPYGLVHRDVSPHNVLVTVDGAAKLIDFGVAKTRFRAACDSTLGELRGRLAFMAPEQAQGDAVDRRSDVWSIGASLFYLLTGHGPFGGSGRAHALRQLLRNAPPLPAPSYVHPAVGRILSGCLTLRREDRFATAEQVACAIEDALDEMGVTASARDVAAFLDELAGDQVRRRRLDIGRCMVNGRVTAIPREMTALASGSLSVLPIPIPLAPRRRGLRLLPAVGACLGLAAAAAAVAFMARQLPPPPPAPAPPPINLAAAPPPSLDVADDALRAPGGERHETARSAQPTPLPQKHARPQPVVRYGVPARNRHDRLSGSRR